MRVQGEIIQIIPWEDKELYFGMPHSCYADTEMIWGDLERDLINIGPVKGKMNLFKKIKDWGKNLIGYSQQKYWIRQWDDVLIEGSLAVLQERPHNFKVGDVINIDVRLSGGGGN